MAACAMSVRAKRSAIDGSCGPYNAPMRSMSSADKIFAQRSSSAAERWQALIEPARHTDILRALSREHE